MKQLLLVEDDLKLCAMVARFLRKHDYKVDTVHSGIDAIKHILLNPPDLVLLDLNLPGCDGREVCQAVRSEYSGEIVIITASDDDLDQIHLLKIGADDYLNKPIKPEILLARIETRLRKSKHKDIVSPAQYCFGSFNINITSRIVEINKGIISLTGSEFDLLTILVKSAGNIISREDIMLELSGKEHDYRDRSIDLKISNLRKKLGDNANKPEKIKTIRGKGYLFVVDGW
jgi:DNA-binding response OmpR family regulator